MALPIVYVLSRVVGVVGWAGRRVNPALLFALMYDRMIGFEKMERMRDERGEALADAVAARGIEHNVSKQVLIEEARANHRKSISQFSRGESVLSISIAIIAVLVKQLPTTLQLPFGVSVSFPSLNTVLLLLTLLLIVSVFFRQTAIEALAFSSLSVFDSYDELMTKRAWNGGTLSYSKLAYNTLVLQVFREWDEAFYQLYLRMIADMMEHGLMARREMVKKYYPEMAEVVMGKFR